MGPKNSQTQPLRIIFIAISAIALLIFTPALSRGEKPFFSIALSKFSSEEAAKKEELNLKNSGNNAFYRREKNPENNQIEYQVYIEKYNSMEEATREAKVLKDLELISDYLVKEVVDTPMRDEHLSETLSEGSGTAQAAGDVRHGPQPEARQEGGSGQIIREQISFKKEATTPGDAPEKPGGQPPLAAQGPADKIPVSETASEKRVPIKEADDQTKGAALQVGAFKEEANAAILKKQLITLGRTAFYQHEAAGSKGRLYRIYITGYKTLGDAVKDAKTLVESGVITGYARTNMKTPNADTSPLKADAAETETHGKIYFIHTGSFKEEVNAQRAVASLKESGYKAFFVPEKESSATWYRVYIGDFRGEAQARQKGMELLEKGVITYFKTVEIDPQEKDN